MFLISFLYGIGYIFYCTYGLTLDPLKKYYNKLLQPKTYLLHLSINILISIYGYYRCKEINPKEAFIFAPLLFLLILPIINFTVRLFTDRNLIITTRWDEKPYGYKWHIDIPASLILIIVPLVSCGHIINKFKFDQFFVFLSPYFLQTSG